MTDIFGIPIQALFGQLLLGLVNGSFYAMLSLGLAVIFGLLNVINFAHGALHAGRLRRLDGPVVPGVELLDHAAAGATGGRPVRHHHRKLLLKHLYKLDHLYGLLLTFGLTLLIEGLFRSFYGVSGQPYPRLTPCAAPPTSAS